MLKQKIAKLMDMQHFTSSSSNYESACKLKQQTFDMYQEVCADVDGTAAKIADLEAEVERLKSDRDRIDWLADPCNHALLGGLEDQSKDHHGGILKITGLL